PAGDQNLHETLIDPTRRANAPSVDECATGRTPRIPGGWRAARNPARNPAAGNRAGEDERTGETAGQDRDVREEERMIVFLNAVIRPEHLAALPADHTDDRRPLRVVAGRGAALLIFARADDAVEFGVGGLPGERYRSNLSESRKLLDALGVDGKLALLLRDDNGLQQLFGKRVAGIDRPPVGIVLAVG